MKLTGNTILITGGASGIGRGLAEAFHRRGNLVIISGRRRGHLDEAVKANPGMRAYELDVLDSANIAVVTRQILEEHPSLDVLVNNAGVMKADHADGPIAEQLLTSAVETNLMGPIRMTGALIEHLKKRDAATIVNVSSVLGFVPFAATAVYSATKAALHSYSQSLRYNLRKTSVEVLELAPPWVRTDLMNSRDAEQAMPLSQFIEQVMAALETAKDEVLVDAAHQLRRLTGPNTTALVSSFNDQMPDVGEG